MTDFFGKLPFGMGDIADSRGARRSKGGFANATRRRDFGMFGGKSKKDDEDNSGPGLDYNFQDFLDPDFVEDNVGSLANPTNLEMADVTRIGSGAIFSAFGGASPSQGLLDAYANAADAAGKTNSPEEVTQFFTQAYATSPDGQLGLLNDYDRAAAANVGQVLFDARGRKTGRYDVGLGYEQRAAGRRAKLDGLAGKYLN